MTTISAKLVAAGIGPIDVASTSAWPAFVADMLGRIERIGGVR